MVTPTKLEVDVEDSIRYYRQENGRLEPAPDQEVAEAKGVLFFCPNCRTERKYKNLEFGEAKRCPKCHTVMLKQL